MSTRKTNTIDDRERYVKVYELELFGKDIADLISSKIDEKLVPVTDKLDDISANTRGLVTQDQHCKDLSELEAKIELKYGSTNKGIDKFKWIVISGLIGICMQVVAFFTLGGIK